MATESRFVAADLIGRPLCLACCWAASRPPLCLVLTATVSVYTLGLLVHMACSLNTLLALIADTAAYITCVWHLSFVNVGCTEEAVHCHCHERTCVSSYNACLCMGTASLLLAHAHAPTDFCRSKSQHL